MTPKERKAALAEVGEAPYWDTVSKWIKDMVRIEPKIMRKVSKATFGDLGAWLEKGQGNVVACGCLVGTTALVLSEERNHFEPKPDYDEVSLFRTTGEDSGQREEVKEVVGELVHGPRAAEARVTFRREMANAADAAGLASAELGSRLGQEVAVALIKDEIVRQLKARSNLLKRRAAK